MATEKKTHLYRVSIFNSENPATIQYVRAYSKAQAISAASSRFIYADRATGDQVMKDRVLPEDVIDATVAPEQEALPLQTAAEAMETGADGSK